MIRCHLALPALFALALPLASHAAEVRKPPRLADPAVLATIKDDDAVILPRGLAPWERSAPPLAAEGASGAPAGRIRTPAEYEANEGILIRWGGYNALQTEMVVPLTTATPPSSVWIVVSGANQQSTATSALQSAGANMRHVRFITAATNSVWIRDYGPRFVERNGRREIVDHTYNRPRPQDNLIPGVIAGLLGEPISNIGLSHGGGNYHSFSGGDAFMTELIVNENPGLGSNVPQQVRDRYALYQGVDLTITAPLPSNYDSTQHIDMWMLAVADDRVIIGQYAAAQGGGVPRQVTEATAADLADRGYTVLRTPGWNAGGAHYTYTNAVIVNQIALICRFGGSYAAQDAQALAVFQQAMPDHDIVQVNCAGIISLSGAIHCIVMHVPDLLFRDPYED